MKNWLIGILWWLRSVGGQDNEVILKNKNPHGKCTIVMCIPSSSRSHTHIPYIFIYIIHFTYRVEDTSIRKRCMRK